MKIVINRCYGGFSLSPAALLHYVVRGGKLEDGDDIGYSIEDRSDPILVGVVEDLGVAANGYGAMLKVVEVPDDVKYTIENYDGVEHVAEVHRTWC